MNASYDDTGRDNADYLQKIRLRPRRMIPVGQFSTSLSVLGSNVTMPIGFSPVAYQALINPEGEIAVAKAAQTSGTIQILSQWASKSTEEVAASAPNAILWQQVCENVSFLTLRCFQYSPIYIISILIIQDGYTSEFIFNAWIISKN